MPAAASALPLAAGNQAAARAATTDREQRGAGGPGGVTAAGAGRGDAQVHLALEDARRRTEEVAAKVPDATVNHISPLSAGAASAGMQGGVPGGPVHETTKGEKDTGFDWNTLLAPAVVGGLGSLGGVLGGTDRIKPSGGAVGAVQVKYDFSSGKWSGLGWIWWGWGFKLYDAKHAQDKWFGSYGYTQIDVDFSHLWQKPHMHGGSPGLAAVPKHKHPANPKGAKGGKVRRELEEHYSLMGGELTFLASKQEDNEYDVEVIVLTDMMQLLPWVGVIKKFVKGVGALSKKTHEAVDVGTGLNFGGNFHASRSENPADGLMGWQVRDGALAAGWHLSADFNLPGGKGSLPGGH